MLFGATLALFLYVAGSLWLSHGLGMCWKILGTAVALLASLKYAIYQWLGGSFFAPRLPRLFQLAMEALYASLILLFALLLLRDILRIALRLLHRHGQLENISLSGGWVWPLLAFCALGAGLWGTWQSVRVPAVVERVVRLPDLPPGLRGFRIAQLSDLHIGPLLGRQWLSQVVRRTNLLQPDLIVLTGDYVDGTVDELAAELEPLADLRSRYGVFAVTGNHEYYWNATAWRAALERLGLRFLENSHALVGPEGSPVLLVGLTDLAADRFAMPGPDLGRALDGAPERGAAPRVLLSHQPREAQEHLASVDLQLSGHTHGGQIFFLQPLIAAFNSGFVSGGYSVNGSSLLVSPGTGLWGGFSCRVGVPSEISLIILEPGR